MKETHDGTSTNRRKRNTGGPKRTSNQCALLDKNRTWDRKTESPAQSVGEQKGDVECFFIDQCEHCGKK